MATQKKGIGELFLKHVPNPFMGKKWKKLIFDGKSRGALLARPALKCMVVTYIVFSKEKYIIRIYLISSLPFID